MTPMTFLLIGHESLTQACAAMLLARGHRIAAIVTRQPELARWATGKDIAVFAPEAMGQGALVGLQADWLLSIAHLEIIPDAVLSLAARGAVNFHDGPLPRYAGLNAPVWARIAGEDRHAITWHRIAGGVDKGEILVTRDFSIEDADTALTLNAKAWEAASDSFPELLALLEAGDTEGTAQDLSQRSWFGRHRRPAAAGLVDFTQPTARIVALVRGLDHGPYANPLLTPKLAAGGRIVAVGAAEPAGAASDAPGTILASDGTEVTVACGEGQAVRLSDLAAADGHAGLPEFRVGDVLASPTAEGAAELDRLVAEAAAREGFWQRRLSALTPPPLEETGAGATGSTSRHVEVQLPRDVGADEAVALLAAALSLAGDAEAFDLALLRPVPAEARGILSDWTPLHLDPGASGATLADLAAAVGEERAAAEGAGWLADLPLRAPDLRDLRRPSVAVGGDGENDSALTLILPQGAADRVTLLADDTRLAPGTAEGLAALMTRLADTDRHVPLTQADLATDADRTLILGPWNDTAAPYDAADTMHAAFARQAALTQDRTALVYEDQTISYRDLDAQANRIANALRDLGVGPDRPVGLFAARSIELVAGALGILKAGGAYLPLDPAYPAERIAHYVADSGASVILSQASLASELPSHSGRVLSFDDPRIAQGPDTPPAPLAGGENLAYVIYTSGSTGTPKGVMLEHRNVANFFTGMDDRIPYADGDTWLALTSLSFDISVLELFWTLARGFTVVVAGDALKAAVGGDGGHGVSGGMDFSLYYWGNDDGAGPRKYELLLEGARFADSHGFKAVWTPERHFHAFGGPYPNPSVTGAAVAAITRNIAVRAGSCVAPLHHPARIAEEWAVIDNLTNGRAGIGIASGWQPDDFVLRPENAPPHNKTAMFETLDQIRRLWRGEAVSFPTANGGTFDVVTQPRPVSKELPIWVTVAGNPATWAEAGRHGAHVLTHLLGQSIDEVAQRITDYHAALRAAGHDPAQFTVTLMLHTYLADTREAAMEVARVPMREYLRSAAGLVKQYAWAFPAFKKPVGVSEPMQMDLTTLTEDELEGILDFAFLRYFNDSGLFGTVEDALARVEQLHAIGVGEVACLIDYGIPVQTVLDGLRPLAEVVARSNADAGPAQGDWSVAAQIRRHNVTHLQCTPSMARLLVSDPAAARSLNGLRCLMLGGEALPPALLAQLQALTQACILNMYGPTETTIWSTTAELDGAAGRVTLGRPVANTRLYVLDDAMRLLPPGLAGELWIGGAGVARGYWNRPDLNAQMFRPDPFAGAEGERIYRTGDLVRWTGDGRLEFLGRVDQQVKLRGHRIELGEIEAKLAALPGIADAVVVIREQGEAGPALFAFVTGDSTLDGAGLRAALRHDLPDVMVPARIVTLPALPLTPNRKIDRKALSRMELPKAERPALPRAPASVAAAAHADRADGQALSAADLVPQVGAIWAKALGLESMAAGDNFFTMGGHSLLAVQVHRALRADLGLTRLSITDLFRFPVLGDFAAHVAGAGAAKAGARPATPPAAVVQPTASGGDSRVDAMARRRALRQGSRTE